MVSVNKNVEGGFFKRNRVIIRSGSVFIILVFVFFFGLSTRTLQRGPVKDFTATIAFVSSKLLGIGISDVRADGTVVQSPKFSIKIVNACNGIYVTALLMAVILATPSPWKHRFLGILIGTAFIYVLNVFRAVSLFIIGSYFSKEAFDFVHVYVWQTLVVILTVAFFLGWTGTLPAPEKGSEEPCDGDGAEGVDTEHVDGATVDNSSSGL